MAGPHGPYLELKSERVQRELAGLPSWASITGGLEGSFRFGDGRQALYFLRRLADLLDAHPEPPRRLALTGPLLTIELGPGRGDRINTGDLALAARISALSSAVHALPSDDTDRP